MRRVLQTRGDWDNTWVWHNPFCPYHPSFVFIFMGKHLSHPKRKDCQESKLITIGQYPLHCTSRLLFGFMRTCGV